MTVEQYSAFVGLMPQIETLLSQKGESVPRPNYDGAPPPADEDDEDEEDDEKKANIEATSDEEE